MTRTPVGPTGDQWWQPDPDWRPADGPVTPTPPATPPPPAPRTSLPPLPHAARRERPWSAARLTLLLLTVLMLAGIGFGIALLGHARALVEKEDEVTTDLAVRAALTAAGTAVAQYAGGTLGYPADLREVGFAEVQGVDVRIVSTSGDPMNGDPVDFCLSGARTGETPILWFRSGTGVTAEPCGNR